MQPGDALVEEPAVVIDRIRRLGRNQPALVAQEQGQLESCLEIEQMAADRGL